MPVSVKGTIKNGVVCPDERVEGREGQRVIITFLEESSATTPSTTPPPDEYEAAADALDELLKQCQVHTGIGDLAHNHDHYLYGVPKRKP